MYKTLAYLYACMKADKMPAMEDMCCSGKLFTIPLKYWETIVLELLENSYMDGFHTVEIKDDTIIHMADTPRITYRGGVNFLGITAECEKQTIY